MTARLDHFAHLITLENGKAGVDAKGEATYAAEFFRWFAEEAVRADGLNHPRPCIGRAHHRAAQAGRAGGADHALELPAAMGTRKIAPALSGGGGGPWINRARLGTPLTMLALDAAAGEAGVPAGLVNVGAVEEDRALVDPHACTDPRVRVVSFTGLHRGGAQAAEIRRRPGGCNRRWNWAGNRARVVLERTPTWTLPVDGTMLAKDAQLGRGLHGGQPDLRSTKFWPRTIHRRRLTERMSALNVGVMARPHRRCPAPFGQCRHPRQRLAEFVRRRTGQGARGSNAGGPGAERAGVLLSGPRPCRTCPETADCVHDEIFGPVAAIQTLHRQKGRRDRARQRHRIRGS